MNKIIVEESVGSAFWLEEGVLFSAPLNADGSIAMEEGGEVEVFDEIDEKGIRAKLA